MSVRFTWRYAELIVNQCTRVKVSTDSVYRMMNETGGRAPVDAGGLVVDPPILGSRSKEIAGNQTGIIDLDVPLVLLIAIEAKEQAKFFALLGPIKTLKLGEDVDTVARKSIPRLAHPLSTVHGVAKGAKHTVHCANGLPTDVAAPAHGKSCR